MDQKSKYTFIIPLLVAVVFAVGMYLGTLFTPQINLNSETAQTTSKYNTILELIEDRYVDSVDHNLLIESSIEGMIQKLDPHSQYIPPVELESVNEQLQGNFGGVGIRFLIHEDTLVATHVLPDSPSELAGMKPGDRIIQVDDSILVDKTINNQMVMDLLKGKPGQKVNVKVYRKGTIKNLEITRDMINISSIAANVMLTNEIGFIKLSSFTMNSAQEFIEAANELKAKGMTKLIFDLRNNGGGFLHEATNMIDQFLEAGKLMVYTEGRKQPKREEVSTRKGILKDTKVIVLINSLSASASEIVAGALQDNDRGIVLGRRSFGKGLVQDQQEFNDGSALRLTISRYYTPSGRCIQKPYGDGIDYDNDYFNRFETGELMHADSVKHVDSLTYTTPKGRLVYGGGGIYPDIFVPNDTAGASYYLTNLYYSSAFNHWAFKFLDNKREKWSTFERFNATFFVSEQMLNDFVHYAEQTLKVEVDQDGLNRSKAVIKNRIKAEIARHLFEENGYYKIYLKDDLDVENAIKSFDDNVYNSILKIQ
ncbi:MAG: S41 family peptidase [Putridiphycobacter sp.]